MMPKINVYLPEDLASAVRDAGISVSPVCQQALAEAVRDVRAAREATGVLRDRFLDPPKHPQITGRITARMTPRLRQVFRHAQALAPPPQLVEPEHLLVGVLDEPGNLGTLVLESLDVDLASLRSSALAAGSFSTPRAAAVAPATPSTGDVLDRLSFPARLTLAAAMDAAAELGHDFLGCEHVVAALAADEEGVSGRLLHERGVTVDDIRRAIPAALAGAVLGLARSGQAPTPGLDDRLADVVRRLDQLEERLRAVGI